MINDDSGGAGFGVYVHWPYCARICPYCDFNVYRNKPVDAARWSAALARDLASHAALTPERTLTSLYFGGGTPSLAPPEIVETVIDACSRGWRLDDTIEITLEANPTDGERARFDRFKGAGVNRLSLGVQSLDDEALRFLGRNHDAAAARGALDAALEIFPRVSADLIYARPGQSDHQWTDELAALIGTGVRHLSLYQLTIEAGTAFGLAVRRGGWAPLTDDRNADLFDLTQSMTAAAGLSAYEISNHGAPKDRSRHNLVYWRQGDYVGVGPGAHGRLTIDGARRATEAERSPEGYLALVEKTGRGAVLEETLTMEDCLTEKLAMGLRTVEGARLAAGDWDAIGARLAPLVDAQMLFRDNGRLVATTNGRRLLNAVLERLLV